MMENYCADALGIHHEALGQLHADRILLDFEQAEKRLLILEIGTGRIAERETLAVIVRLMRSFIVSSGGSPIPLIWRIF